MFRLSKWVFKNLGDEPPTFGPYIGVPSPPGSALRFEFLGPATKKTRRIYVATTDCDDYSGLLLGEEGIQYIYCDPKEARRLAWFILWTWRIKGTWFGLKKRLWCWALNKQTIIIPRAWVRSQNVAGYDEDTGNTHGGG